ncbi:30S ribosome-binding factor RbfA [Saccharicrinis sp. FJH54]|uniref:30S ribosome-binding factor RbfA n=1 Tax=Saccharicrinis sp. FJH54 TaxID=3344665 RepID=UPI0035D3FD40
MESTRQEKIAKLLQKDLGEIFQRETQLHAPGKLITVTIVRVSPDLGIAKVYLSIFPSSDAASVVETINIHKGHYRNLLAKKVRHQLRVIPDLQFYMDDSEDYVRNIDSLLNE